MIQRKALPDRKGPFCVAGFEVRRADAMTQKSEIVKCLGESAVLLPGLIAAALAAVFDKPHTVIAVKPVAVPAPHLNVWAFEGRIELTMSHRVR